MKKYLNSHLKVLRGIYYFLVIVLFAEISIYCYFHLINERSKQFLDGTIHYDGNSSVNFDANEVVIDIHEVKPNVIYVEDNSTKPTKVKKKEVKSTVYRFNYDEDYTKTCELYNNQECANSKKILGYSGNKLYLDKVYISNDGSLILGLFEHNIYAYKYTRQDGEKCSDKSFGKYTIKNNEVTLEEKANVSCDSCVKTFGLSNKSYSITDNTINDFYQGKSVKLLDKYSEIVLSIAYEMGYFDGNIKCDDSLNSSNIN